MISKALSYLLRHGALQEGLSMDSAGYCKLSEVLNHNRLKSHGTTEEDVERIVANDNKQRFTLKTEDGVATICANQGHSIKHVGDANLTLLSHDEYPDKLIHGTTHAKLGLILNSGGLSKMSRNHIHFTNLETSMGKQVSGVRSFSTVLVYIDIEKLKNTDIKLYQSLNNVYLTTGDERGLVPKELFSRIVDRETGEPVHHG